MKNDNRVLFVKDTSSDEWETPKYLFDKWNELYHFNLDVSANRDNYKCVNYFDKRQNGLIQQWHGNVWCNPPYSNVSKWVEKASMEMYRGVTTVMLIPARTDTRWFHQFIYKRTEVQIEFIKGRLKFSGSKWNAPFPSMIVIFKNQVQGKLF